MKYACLVYLDSAAMDGLSPEAGRKLNDDCMEFDAAMLAKGHTSLAYPMQRPDRAVAIRRRDGKLSSTDGPFAETKEFLGGFFLIDAGSVDEAIQLAGQSPVLDAGGRIEIRPFLVREHS